MVLRNRILLILLTLCSCSSNEISIQNDGNMNEISSSSSSSSSPSSTIPLSSVFTTALANITHLKTLLEDNKLSYNNRINLLEELADTYTRIHYYNDSIPLRNQIIQDKYKYIQKKLYGKNKEKLVSTKLENTNNPSSTSSKVSDMGATNCMSLIKQYVSLAQDYKDNIVYDNALDILQTAEKIIQDSPSCNEMYPSLLPLVYRMEATMLDCKGDDINALSKFTRAKKLALQQDKQYTLSLSETLQHIHLLQKIITNKQKPANIPLPIYQGIEKEYHRQVSGLLQTGPWIHPQQLPKVFIPSLLSLPWHNWSTNHWSHLQIVATTLINAHSDLLLDLQELKQNNQLDRETECIHDAYSGGWRFHMLNGYWVPKDKYGCSLYTPRACQLLQRIKQLNIPNFQVIRGGFSLIDNQAYLKPHFGLTNAQLKFHLGLIIPKFTTNHTACAYLRVGNETRAWKEKDILFFDDSYEHEVWNYCSSERAVFQLVFAHPDLSTEQREKIFSKALQESH